MELRPVRADLAEHPPPPYRLVDALTDGGLVAGHGFFQLRLAHGAAAKRRTLPDLRGGPLGELPGALDDASPGAPWGLLVRFTAWTGLRAGEVAGLNIGDVDLAARVLHVRRTRERRAGEWHEATPKSGKTRRVPLVGWLAEDLREYLAAHPHAEEPTAPLWPGARPGGWSHGSESPTPGAGAVRVSGAVDYDRPWESGTFYRRRYLPAVRAAGLPTGQGGVNFHALRHTYASLCASAGISSQQVAAWMGHANDVVTRTIYVHLFAEDTVAAVAALENAGRVGERPRLALVPNESGKPEPCEGTQAG